MARVKTEEPEKFLRVVVKKKVKNEEEVPASSKAEEEPKKEEDEESTLAPDPEDDKDIHILRVKMEESKIELDTKLRPKLPPRLKVELDKRIQNITVSRQSISHLYGGNSQDTIPTIAKHHSDRTGKGHFFLMNTEYNPLAPTKVGQSGYFTTQSNSPYEEEHTTFIKVATKKYKYLGEYKYSLSVPMTTDEWQDQKPKCKKTWGDNIRTKDWGSNTKAKVSFWKRYGRVATEEELLQHKASEPAKNAKGRFAEVTPDHVIEWFASGKQTMHLWKMECVWYDEAFQRDLATRGRAYDLDLERKKEAEKQIKAQNGEAKGRVKKRKSSPSDSPIPRESPARKKQKQKLKKEDDSESDSIEVTAVRRGTRSRPKA